MLLSDPTVQIGQLLTGQVAPDPSPWAQLGVYAVTVTFAVWVVLILLKMIRDRDRKIEEKDQEIRDLHKEKDLEVRELSRGQMALSERVLPSLNETARVVAEASDELRRSRRQ